jgi:hypothetical protein
VNTSRAPCNFSSLYPHLVAVSTPRIWLVPFTAVLDPLPETTNSNVGDEDGSDEDEDEDEAT